MLPTPTLKPSMDGPRLSSIVPHGLSSEKLLIGGPMMPSRRILLQRKSNKLLEYRRCKNLNIEQYLCC